jgi:hypothetical protein
MDAYHDHLVPIPVTTETGSPQNTTSSQIEKSKNMEEEKATTKRSSEEESEEIGKGSDKDATKPGTLAGVAEEDKPTERRLLNLERVNLNCHI